MSVANKKTYQTSRMYYKGKDHKAIWYERNYHHNIVLTDENGNYDFSEDNKEKLAWHKEFDDEYIIFPYKILVYPKEKVLASPMKHTAGSWMQFSNYNLGVRCGTRYYDIYDYGLDRRITKLTKDGRILYKTLSTESPSLNFYPENYYSYSFGYSRLGNNFSCAGGFLTFTRYRNTSSGNDEDIVNFQQVDANGDLGSSIFICDTGVDFNTNEIVRDVFALNGYIWVYSFNETVWSLHKISPTSGSIVSTYTKQRTTVTGTMNTPEIHIVNNTIYFTTQHWHSHRDDQGHVVYDIQHFLVYDETFTTVFYIDELPHYTFSSTITLGMAYVKGAYYLYVYWNTNGHPSLRVYSGGSVSGLSLVRTIAYNTQYTFSNLSNGGNSMTLNLTPENYTNYRVSKYHNTYRDRQLVTTDNYVVINEGYVFDNGELDFNEDCFYVPVTNINSGPAPSQETIWDKYFNTQQGGE